MSLPIRRATPQPRPLPIRSKRIVPAPLASPQAKAVFAKRPYRAQLPRPRITASRLVRPAPLASPQAKAVFAKRPYRAWILRPSRSTSRRIVPAPPVAGAIPPATLALRGIKRFGIRPPIAASRSIRPAPLASPQPQSTKVSGVKRPPTRPYRSRLISAAPLASPQAKPPLAAQGIKRGPTRPYQSRRVIPAPFVAPPPLSATWALVGARRPTGKPPRARIIVAPLAAPQPKSTNVAGIRRGPTRNNRSRFFIGIAAPFVAVPATIARQGVRRTHPKRPPLSRLFVAPFVAPITGTALRWRIDSLEPSIATISSEVSLSIVSSEPTVVLPSQEPSVGPSTEIQGQAETPARYGERRYGEGVFGGSLLLVESIDSEVEGGP